MKERIEIQDKFSIKDCLANPNKVYIFGDNLVSQGFGGQAIIRNCPNAWGIPTKALPSTNEEAYFHDNAFEMFEVNKELRILLSFYKNTKDILVFPSNGIGTGRAKLKEKSPQIHKLIDDFFKEHFDLDIMNSGN